MHSSTIYTIGTALRRAGDTDMPVEVLVEGHWLRGTVAGVDSHGLILTTHAEHSVIRLEAISAVRVPEALSTASASATQEGIDSHMLVRAGTADRNDAWAMPSSFGA